MSRLFEPLPFARGPAMKNRFMLAPLTNLQSREDGVLSDEEFRWLVMRAEGGFGLTMTCAAHVQAAGKGFSGQLGIFDDMHIEGLTRLASAIRARESIAIAQLHHAGMRAPKDLIGQAPLAPSDDAETGARAMTANEVERLAEDFIAAARRAEKAGFQGVELHGAHGYVLCQFLSSETNRRDDRWGGPLENRSRILQDIIAGVRSSCRADFVLGVRLSPERFGLKLAEIVSLANELMQSGNVDFIDLSMWDVFKEPLEPEHHGRSLLSYFTTLDRKGTRLGVAGKISGGDAAVRALGEGADFAILGRAAILHHDLPKRVAANPAFQPHNLPVTSRHLAAEGLSPKFINYMRSWKGFVTEEALEVQA